MVVDLSCVMFPMLLFLLSTLHITEIRIIYDLKELLLFCNLVMQLY